MQFNKRNERGEIGLKYISKNLYNPKIIISQTKHTDGSGGAGFVRIEIDGLGSLDEERVMFFGDTGFVSDGTATVIDSISLFKVKEIKQSKRKSRQSIFRLEDSLNSNSIVIKFGILETNE